MFTKAIYTQRREQLRKDLKEGLILILGNTDVSFNYPANIYSFRQDSTFLYFFGLNQQNMCGVLDCETGKDWIFANDLDMDDIIWMGDLPSIKELGASVGVEHTAPSIRLQEVIKAAMQKGKPIHFLPPYRTENQIQLSQLLDMPFEKVRSLASVDLIKACVKQRSIKSVEEVAEIEKAINTAYLMHTTAMKMAHPGRVEYELAGAMEGIALAGGGPVSFPIILTVNGQTLHNHYHGNTLQVGRMVVMDAGCENPMSYCSDITRSVPVGGKFDARQKSIYEIVLQANMEATQHITPGKTYRDIHLQASRVLASGLKNLGILKGDIDDIVANGAHALFMPHGLGHMMGMDVHDMENYGENYVGYDEETVRSTQFGLSALRLGRRLQPGFVLTNEPGCYFIPALIDKWRNEKINTAFINFDVLDSYRDFGGIRIEDDILVTESGCRVLGKPIPKTISEVESLMQL